MHMSAGVKVLHYLCHLINHLPQHECFVNCKYTNPNWKEKTYNNEKIDILIYPEIYQEPKIDFKKVRWCLYHPGIIDGPTIYNSSEIIFYYDEAYKNSVELATPHMKPLLFYLPSIELKNYKNNSIKKSIEGCYYIGKGENNLHFKLPKDNLILINRSFPTEKKKLIELLLTSKKFYSYDNESIINLEALLCGCDVYEFRNNNWVKFKPIFNTKYYLMKFSKDIKLVKQFINQIKEIYE